jgi:hypothetical protein
MKSLRDPLVREAVVRRITQLRPDMRPRWGRMTAHQMLCHLSDSFRVCMGERKVSPATGPLQRTLMKWFALYVPLPWPKGVPTRPEVEQGAGGTPPGEFEADRADVLNLLRRFSDDPRDFEWHPHPIFDNMKDEQWLRWAYLHTDHHLRQFGL